MHAARMSARWQDSAGRARLGWQARWLHASVRGVDHHPVQRDAVCRCSPLVNLSRHRVAAICKRYVDLALAEADFSADNRLAVDETSRAKGHNSINLFADADERKVLHVAKERGADTVVSFAEDLRGHGGDPEAIEAISIDMSPALIKGVGEHLPNARITFDELHVVAHANMTLDKTRRIEQRPTPA